MNYVLLLLSVGECTWEVPAGCEPDGRRAAHEEVHVGPVLVGSPEVLQIPLHRLQSPQSGPARQRGGPERKGGTNVEIWQDLRLQILFEISVCGKPSCTHVLGFLNVLSQTIPETIHCLSVSLLKIVTSCFLCSVWWSVFSPLEKQEHWRLWRKEEESSTTLCRLQSTYRLQMISLTPSLSCL